MAIETRPRQREKTPHSRRKAAPRSYIKCRTEDWLRRLDDFARLDAAGADANTLIAASRQLGLDRAKIDVPTPARNVVRVRDVVSELRTFAADIADLCHDLLQNR